MEESSYILLSNQNHKKRVKIYRKYTITMKPVIITFSEKTHIKSMNMRNKKKKLSKLRIVQENKFLF